MMKVLINTVCHLMVILIGMMILTAEYIWYKKWVETSGFEIDERSGHQTGCNMIYPYDDIKKDLGYHQLEVYVPIKLKGEK